VAMIKIMQVLTDYSVGDAGMWLLNFLGLYDRDTYEMVLVLPTGSQLVKYAESLEVRVIETDALLEEEFSLSAIKELKQMIKEEEPDLVHTHAGALAGIAAWSEKVPAICTCHSTRPPKGFFKRFVSRLFNRMFYACTVAVSESVMENLIEDGVPQKRIRLIYNGIYPMKEYAIGERSVLRELHNISQESVVIGIATPLEEEKNHAMFIEAAKFIATACPEVLFMVMGDGSLRKELEKMSESLEERILFTGYLSDMTEALNMIDILAVSSRQEGMSIPLLEAMSVSVPVVATDVGGNRELVQHGKSGVVVGCEDAVSFAMALIRLAQHPELRQSMGAVGKSLIDRRFSAETMVTQTEAVYQEIAGQAEETEEIEENETTEE